MIALDSNILLDLLIPGAPHKGETKAAMEDIGLREHFCVSEAVCAEVAGQFRGEPELRAFLDGLWAPLVPSSPAALYRAGEAWRLYTSRRPDGLQCPACGQRNGAPRCEGCGESLRARQHIVADFLVGAHALEHADRLLTRDRGFYAEYFPELRLA